MSLIGKRGRLDIGGYVSISSDISCSVASGWATISNVDAVSCGVRGLLRSNSGDSESSDSRNILIRSCVLSSCVGRSGMIEVDSGDDP